MTGSPASSRPRVLLVEDDAETRQTLRELLEAEGIEVVGEAGDGAEGVELARKFAPDVVLMDLRMPQMGGIEATRIITGSLPKTRVVLLTSFDSPSLRRVAIAAGAYVYLPKGRARAEDVLDAILKAVGFEEQEPSTFD